MTYAMTVARLPLYSMKLLKTLHGSCMFTLNVTILDCFTSCSSYGYVNGVTVSLSAVFDKCLFIREINNVNKS